MKNDPDVIQKAKRYVKRYKICRVMIAACVILGYCLVASFGNNTATLLAAVVGSFICVICSRILSTALLSVLNKKLDADTYLAVIYHGNLDTPAALWQLLGEYYCGNYQNVISICQMKLAEPKIAKRYKYTYFSYLANVYFEVGDDERLRNVCEQYEAAFEKEKPGKKAKLKSVFPRMTFFDFYLKQNIDACITWVNVPAPGGLLTKYHRTFCRAKLAHMQGNEEEAVGYYEELAKEIPQLNYGKLAADKLAEQNNQSDGDCSKIIEISDEPTEVTLYTNKIYKRRKVFVVCLIVLALICSVIGIVGRTLRTIDTENDSYTAYLERTRILVEQDYDGVVMLDAFNLVNGEEIIDSMFICKTNEDIIVGCTYTYRGETRRYYEKMTSIPIDSLSAERSPLWYCSFPSKTSHNQIKSYFYAAQADVPVDYCHLSTFEINGQKIYYVITEIVPGIVIPMPNV